MVLSMMRFNMIAPGVDPAHHSAMHKEMLDMAEYGEKNGFSIISTEEHHGADNGWSPCPKIFAASIFGRTKNMMVTFSAILLPLHDPLRMAEDIAVLDLISGGRTITIFGMGYRPEEYEMAGVSWKDRGKVMDECVDAVLKGWTGEPFEFRGRKVRVTPRPFTQPHPILMLGGTSKPAVRRAARFGLPISLAANMPELEAVYNEECAKHGTQGFISMPPAGFHHTWVADDPDAAWDEIGKYLLHEAMTYSAWQTPDIRSAVHSHASTPAELRAEGIYRIMTPDESIAELKGLGEGAAAGLHPFCGGMPIDTAWKYLSNYVEKVLGKLTTTS